MATTDPAATPGTRRAGLFGGRRSTETKDAPRTTEFFAYLGVLIALFIAGAVVEGDVEAGTPDVLDANRVWLYAVILTVGYMVSRGLAKSGSREPSTPDATVGR